MSTEPAAKPVRIQVLRLRGELNLEDMLKIKNLIGEYLRSGLVNVALNLEHVQHVHLAGLSVLGERQQRLKEYGGDLKLVGASVYLRHIFELAGVASSFDWCVDEAQLERRYQGATH